MAQAQLVHSGLQPDFLIIGAQRCGTTSLYDVLSGMPHIVPATIKEVHFFDNEFHRGIDWYLDHFPKLRQESLLDPVKSYGETPERIITGEASPYYLFHPLAARRVVRMFPDVKLVVLLRNPVDRAFSHYYHEVRSCFETLSFEEALRQEKTRLRGELWRLSTEKNYYSFNHQHFSYQARGIYVDQLKHWAQLFPRTQMLVLDSETFFKSPQPVVEQVCRFLGIPVAQIKNMPKLNEGGYAPMNVETRNKLNQYFAPHNQRLFKWLGKEFNWG